MGVSLGAGGREGGVGGLEFANSIIFCVHTFLARQNTKKQIFDIIIV